MLVRLAAVVRHQHAWVVSVTENGGRFGSHAINKNKSFVQLYSKIEKLVAIGQMQSTRDLLFKQASQFEIHPFSI